MALLELGLKKYGNVTAEVPSSKSIVIRTAPDGEKLMDEMPPAGKKWLVHIFVDITETDE